ncbi:MAG: hypothetical protein JWN67_3686 [Actinomycetia bacterium]|nr:hypothetical protein [Actinomycetes bacterium]
MRRRTTFAALLTAYALCNTPSFGPVYSLALIMRWPILVFGAAIAVGQPRRQSAGFAAVWLMMLAALAAISALWSTDRVATIFYFFVALTFLAALDGLLGARNSGVSAEDLVGMLAVLHVVVIVGTLAYLVLRPGLAIDSSNVRGIIGNSNGLGVLLALTAPAIWTWRGVRRHPALFVGLCALGPVLIFASRSRSALLALAGAGVVSLVRARLAVRIAIGYGLVVLVVLALALGHGAEARRWFVEDLLYKDQRNGDVLSSRRTAFSLTWQSAEHHLIVGRGFGIIATPAELRDEGANVPRGSTGHREVGNAYLGLLEQLGWLGAGVFGVLALAVLAAVRRAVRGHSPATVTLAAIIVGSLVAANFEAYLFATGAVEALITWSAVVVVVRSRTRIEVPV